MTEPSPTDNGATRHNETRTTHNQSINTESTTAGGAGARARPEPQQPNDIDESSHSQASATTRHDEVGKQAYLDTLGPTQDTDKAPVTDAVYNEKLAPDRGSTPPRQ